MYLKQRGQSLGKLSQLFSIPEGAEGVRQTLYLMRALANQAKTDPAIRDLAASIFRSANLDQKDYAGEIRALHGYVRDRIRYMRDIEDVETIQTPQKTISLGMGDCDDKSTLLATLLKATGHPARFLAVGLKTLGEFSHVYVDTFLKNSWIPLETTENVPAGWGPPNVVSKMIVKV